MRLADLSPEDVAKEVVRRCADHHTTRILFDLHMGAEVRGIGGDWRGTQIGHAAYVIAHYAISGTPPPDAPVAEYLQSWCEALYTRPGDSGGYDVPPIDRVDGEPTEPHEIVLVAAVARDLLAQDAPISLVHLAVLASVSYQYVRALSSRGEIATDGKRGIGARGVAPEEARRWLGARGVAGFRGHGRG